MAGSVRLAWQRIAAAAVIASLATVLTVSAVSGHGCGLATVGRWSPPDPVTFGGSFRPNATITLTTPTGEVQGETTSLGEFSYEYANPPTRPGVYTVTASDGECTAEATFRIEGPPDTAMVDERLGTPRAVTPWVLFAAVGAGLVALLRLRTARDLGEASGSN